MKEQIKVTLNPDGTVKLEGIGFKGKTCDEAMRFIEEGLGLEGTRTNKPEYYQGNAITGTQNVGGGK